MKALKLAATKNYSRTHSKHLRVFAAPVSSGDSMFPFVLRQHALATYLRRLVTFLDALNLSLNKAISGESAFYARSNF
jgi:hypothetical protein